MTDEQAALSRQQACAAWLEHTVGSCPACGPHGACDVSLELARQALGEPGTAADYRPGGRYFVPPGTVPPG